MLATRARDGLCAVAYCNLVGGQDELVFDGRSAVFGPDGAVLARAASFAEELLVCDLELDASVHERLRDSRLRRGRRRRRVHPPVTIELPLGSERAPLAPSVALAAGAARPAELWAALRLGPDRLRAQERLRARRCSASPAASTRRSWRRSPPTRSGPTASRPSRCRRATTARARAATRGSWPSGSESRSARSRSRTCACPSSGALPGTSGLAAENLQARIRGVLLMTLSNQHGWLVLTTGNKSETAVGYSTLYGDSAGGFAPIKDVSEDARLRARAPRQRAGGPRADPRLDHRAPALGRAARRPARRPVAAAVRRARPADRGLRRGRPLARGDRAARPRDARGGAARRRASSISPSTSAGRLRPASRCTTRRSVATGACRSPTASVADAGRAARFGVDRAGQEAQVNPPLPREAVVSAWLWAIIVAAILVVAVLILTTSIRRRRSAELRSGFGPEYDRTIERVGDRERGRGRSSRAAGTA